MFKTIREWMNEFDYELCEGYNYESVYPFRGLLNYRTAKEVLIDAVQLKIIRKKD
jgi:3-deoxy-D-arabino-heptulosonate 7-phosphate (DAHP) synthase